MEKVFSEGLAKLSVKDLMIPADKVAHVQIGNNLEHALLLLTKSGYAAVPVLDPQFRLHGLISTNNIMDSILGLERIEFERLQHMKVEEVMMKNMPRLLVTDDWKKAFKLVIDHTFICVTDEGGVLEGIFTRRVILKKLHQQLHFLQSDVIK